MNNRTNIFINSSYLNREGKMIFANIVILLSFTLVFISIIKLSPIVRGSKNLIHWYQGATSNEKRFFTAYVLLCLGLVLYIVGNAISIKSIVT